MKRSALAWQALGKGIGGLAVMGLLLFLSAGSWGYWQAWLFLGLLFVPMTCLATWLLVREPELLEKRLQSKEQEKEQRHVVALSALMFVAGFLLAGFDQRYGWSEMPAWVVAVAAVLMLCGYAGAIPLHAAGVRLVGGVDSLPRLPLHHRPPYPQRGACAGARTGGLHRI